MKILTVIGARPQFIKAGSVSRELGKNKDIDEVIVHTGQHYDANMSDIFFEEMKIPKPDYFLGIGSRTHGAMTGQMIEKIEDVAFKEKPDWVVVYGDTNSTLAGAIVASKMHIKLAHIEAGLRSFNMHMPEEVNRILTDRVSNLLFCPTEAAMSNLQLEGYDNFNCKVVNSGDVMLDGANFYRKHALKPMCDLENDFILSTVHRAENTDDISRLTEIIEALDVINSEKNIVLPVHPRTRKIIEQNGIKTKINMIDPVGYLEMIWLLENCCMVMTDSGGLQKEAYFFGKPCITLRDETEWVELVECGANVLAGADKNKIIDLYKSIDNRKVLTQNLYGDGRASTIIVTELLNYLEKD